MNRIVVIEDDPAIRRGLALTLSAESYEVLTAAHGSEGYRMVCEKQPDLVILDLMLPGMNGYELIQRLREQPEMHDVRFIALTGYGQEEDRLRAKSVGFDYHLTKPIDPEVLEALLDSLRWDDRASNA